jgi:LmbE family N-acetylglucosaminyl deacetylase
MSLAFDYATRMMVICPHPDDETLAAGGILQQVCQGGGATCVVFVTSGDNNPWPQRVIERRWRITAADRIRFGQMRKGEALAAIGILGLEPMAGIFLEYPDQGLTELLVRARCEDVVEKLAERLSQWKPTHVIYPSGNDIHPDHSAVYVLMKLAMRMVRNCRPMCLEYVVHSRRRGRNDCEKVVQELSSRQRDTKLAAINCHKSQLIFRFRSIKAKVRLYEEFFCESRPAHNAVNHPVRDCVVEGVFLKLAMGMHACIGAFGVPTVYLACARNCRIETVVAVELKSSTGRGEYAVPVINVATGKAVADGIYRRNRQQAQLKLPIATIGNAEQLFVKLERQFGFFDEAGWREIPISN